MSEQSPEQQARQRIDRMLAASGWVVQNHREMNITAALGVVIREFPLRTGFADYLLYADGRALGVIEAKPEGHTLTGVETQSHKYTEGLPAGLTDVEPPCPWGHNSGGWGCSIVPGAERRNESSCMPIVP